MNADLLQELDAIVRRLDVEPQEIEREVIALAKRLKAQGMGQLEMYDLFSTYHESIRDEPDDKTDAYEDVLDRIWGWCIPERKLFPAFMTNEMWEEYKRRKSQI